MAQHGFGLIGCGMIAEFHTRAINEIPERPGGRRLQPEPGQRREDRRDGPTAGARSTTIWRRCWPIPGLDVVCICTPSGAHLEPAVQAARAGKHVVVEKPLEITLARCDAIIDACDAAGVRLCTIFPSRFTPANLRLKEAIDGGRFGRLTLGDTYVKWWRTQEYYDSGGWRGHLGARRRRRPHEPGDPQRRPALLADGRRRVDRGPDRDPGPRTGSRSRTRPWPASGSRTAPSA